MNKTKRTTTDSTFTGRVASQQRRKTRPSKQEESSARDSRAASPSIRQSDEDPPLIVKQAKRPGDKMAARALIKYTRSAFDCYVQFASATDLYLLHQVFLHADVGPYSLVETVLDEVGLKLPETAATC
jgi:hypothetical protein